MGPAPGAVRGAEGTEPGGSWGASPGAVRGAEGGGSAPGAVRGSEAPSPLSALRAGRCSARAAAAQPPGARSPLSSRYKRRFICSPSPPASLRPRGSPTRRRSRARLPLPLGQPWMRLAASRPRLPPALRQSRGCGQNAARIPP